MGYLLLVTLLTFVLAPPTPAKNQTGTEGKPTASSSAPAIKGDGQNLDPKDSQPTIKVTDIPPLKVTEIPSVTVVPSKRTWVDWGYWVFNLLLAGVGCFQVYLLWKTLTSVQRQADLMKRQADKLDESVAIADKAAVAAKESADAAKLNADAVINTERPWLVIDIRQDESSGGIHIVRAINKGKTPAEMHEGHCKVDIHPVGFIPPDDLKNPFVAPIQTLTMSGDDFVVGRINLASFNDRIVATPPCAIFAYGRIIYWDMFTDRSQKDARPHETRWCLTYETARKIWYRTANGYSLNT